MRRKPTAGGILPPLEDASILLYDKLQAQGDTLPLPAVVFTVRYAVTEGFLSRKDCRTAPDGRQLYRAFVKREDGFCASAGYLPDDTEIHTPLDPGRGPWQEPRPHTPIAAEADAVFLAWADGDIGLYNRLLDFADMRAANGKEIRTRSQASDVVRALCTGASYEQEPRTAIFKRLAAAIEKRHIIPRSHDGSTESTVKRQTWTPPQTDNIIKLSDFRDSKKRRL